MTDSSQAELARVSVDPQRAVVYEHGWQSWSPSGWYRLDARPPRPTAPNHHVMAYRPGVDAGRFQGEGLLAVATGGEVVVVAATTPEPLPTPVPTATPLATAVPTVAPTVDPATGLAPAPQG